MALIRGSARYLLTEAQAGRLHQLLSEQARHQWEHQVGVGEVRSWMRSLPPLLNELVDAGLGDVEVLLEHKLPHSPKRVDVILCGVHPRTGEVSYVLVELKQWSKAELLVADLVSIAAYSDAVLHPVAQVRAYCQYLVDSTPALADLPLAVHGIAYLHNATSTDIPSLMKYRSDRFGRMFTEDFKSELVEHLRALLDVAAGRDQARESADRFLRFAHGPSKPLLQLAAKEIQDREQFVLLDEQRVAYQLVEQAVATARAQRTQTVVVVLGGPGSGKSVIALSLLGELSRQGRKVHHATGSSAFTNTMRKVAGSRNTRVKTMFKYFNNYVGSEPRELDVLICDEAHRVRENSVNRWTGKEMRALAGRQIDELIDVAWVPVFLLDENQIVRPGEMGSLDEITAAATAAGCGVEIIRLDGQFRCGGSDAFDEWVGRLLGLAQLPPISWSRMTAGTDDDFKVVAAANPAAMEAWLRSQSERHSGIARLAAGYCWPWSDPIGTTGAKHLVADVAIGDWKRPWNAKPGKRVPDAPESYYWASDDRGFGQIGCIYTAQGFEYDWSGVIFGPDFVRRGDRWVARREYSHDPAVKKAEEAHFGALIRNTYKVLLTRGMEGTCVYSTDAETQEFLEKMVG
ncbi:DNA/RNA helicase domain-containing protein [Nocardia tengchongensis]|uniref:DNA/RNA helicase domain-containing protein n=1 Tax=Nocardia tengchongensis TaxID=2055889 RepID=UPI0036496F78